MSRVFCRAILGSVALVASLGFGVWTLHMRPAVLEALDPPAPQPAAAVAADPSTLVSIPYGLLTDPTFFADSVPARPIDRAPREASLEPNRMSPAVETLEPKDVAAAPVLDAVTANPETVATLLPQPGETVPLPVSRPADLTFSERRSPPASSGRRIARQTPAPVASTPLADIGAFFDKLFGSTRPVQPALAYAPAQGGVSGVTGKFGSRASAAYDRWTAVYDVSARTVYMPDGTRLEAHSGLGHRMDDPRYVHEPMRGATPPNVYALQPREELFHGVPALRLIPIGNGELYGRNGFLAHSYMLGPNGDSNGCVSFRNYDAFLQAYRNGAVKRLVVVASL